MTDGDLAAQRASMELFGWVHEGTTLHTSFWGEPHIGIEVYTCPRCGGLVSEGWLHTHGPPRAKCTRRDEETHMTDPLAEAADELVRYHDLAGRVSEEPPAFPTGAFWAVIDHARAGRDEDEMTIRRITVTRAQREAAKLLIERDRTVGNNPDPALLAIANAELRRAEMEAWPWCCNTLRGATSTGTVTNGFRDGLGWGIPVSPGLVVDIEHCPWCGHNLTQLSPQAGVRPVREQE